MLDSILRYLRQKKIISYIPDGSIICDIGCGKKAYFLKKVSSLIRFGFGFDKNILPYKDSKLELRNINLEEASLFLKKNSIDIVTMMAVLEHLNNPQNILKEIFRILKPGGFLILTTPTPKAKPVLDFLAFKLKIINKNDISEHKNYFFPEEIKNLLVRNGFNKEKIKYRYFEFGFNILLLAQK